MKTELVLITIWFAFIFVMMAMFIYVTAPEASPCSDTLQALRGDVGAVERMALSRAAFMICSTSSQ